MSSMSNEKGLLSSLNDSDKSIRIKALQSLAKNSNVSNSSILLSKVKELTTSEDIAIRFWAKKVLNQSGKYDGAIFNKSADIEQKDIAKDLPIEILIQKLETISSTFISLDLIKKLCVSKREEAFDFLTKYLKNCQDVIQISYLVKNLGVYYPTPATLKLIVPYLSHNDDRIVANTIEGLEAIKAPQNVVLYSQLLEHKSNRVRSNAAKALASHNPEQAYKVVEKMLSGNSGNHFQISACYAIKSLQSDKYLSLLEQVIFDDEVFPYALGAIQCIKGDKPIQFLLSHYSKFDPEKREFVDETINLLTNQNVVEKNQSPSSDKICCSSCNKEYDKNIVDCPYCQISNHKASGLSLSEHDDINLKKNVALCPICGKTLKNETKVCKNCGADVNFYKKKEEGKKENKKKGKSRAAKKEFTYKPNRRDIKKSGDLRPTRQSNRLAKKTLTADTNTVSLTNEVINYFVFAVLGIFFGSIVCMILALWYDPRFMVMCLQIGGVLGFLLGLGCTKTIINFWDINKNYLQKDEEIEYIALQNIFRYIIWYLLFFLQGLSYIVMLFYSNEISDISGGMFVNVIWISFFSYHILKRLSTRYAITNRGVLKKTGIFTNSVKTVPFRHITSIEVRETLFGKVLDYSSLLIDTSGSGLFVEFRWDYISSAHTVKKIIEKHV